MQKFRNAGKVKFDNPNQLTTRSAKGPDLTSKLVKRESNVLFSILELQIGDSEFLEILK